MNIYVTPNAAVEDLVNTIEELKPGMVTSRMVLEISTEDKSLGALLKSIAEGVPDELNAAPSKRAKKIGKRGKAVALPGSLTAETVEADGFPA